MADSPNESYGWRGKIGFAGAGGDFCSGSEYYPMLPEGVALDWVTLGVSKLQQEDIEQVYTRYLPVAKHLAGQECDVIILGGSVVFSFVGIEQANKMIESIRQVVGVPVLNNLDTHLDALRCLSAHKIALVTPYEEARNEERKRVCESYGFEVIGMKGLGLKRRIDIEKLPHYASYRLAREAARDYPEADAIYISCPEWPTIRNIKFIEADTGKPVVAASAAVVWAGLKAIGIKEKVMGFGRLLEECL